MRDASSIIPSGAEGFSIFAYKLLPVRFGDEAEPWPLPDLAVEPLPSSFRSLGFDIVSKDLSDFFECSPLSCNGLADEVHVNRYCLVESLERAIALAEQFARGPGVEPGYYHVLEIFRDS